MCKMDFKKAEEPEVKLPTLTGSWRKQGNSRKTSASLTMLKPFTLWITANYGKIFKRWEYQTTLPVSWETCIWIKKQQKLTWNDWLVQNWERNMSRLHIVTLFVQLICIMRNTRLNESQAEIRIARRNISNLRYADDTTLMSESKKELKSLLMRVKEESEKPGLKLNVKKN